MLLISSTKSHILVAPFSFILACLIFRLLTSTELLLLGGLMGMIILEGP